MSETINAMNEEERAAVERAQRAALEMANNLNRPQDAPMSPSSARQGDEPMVFVLCAKAFLLNLDHQRRVEFPVGTYLCPTRLAVHWFAVGNGLKVLSAADIRDSVPMGDLTAAEQAAVRQSRARKMMADAEAALAAAKAAAAEADADSSSAGPVAENPAAEFVFSGIGRAKKDDAGETGA